MVRRQFGRDEHGFILKTPQWREVEERCGAGLFVLAARLAPLVNLIEVGPANYPGGLLGAMAAGALGSARIDDVREVVLQGLIGHGMPTTQAGALVKLVFDEALAHGEPVMITYGHLAFEIVSAAILGPPGEPAGETTAATRPEVRRRSPTARRGSASSTPPPN